MEVRRKISPYDLSAADNPRAVRSLPLLKGTNYDEWACRIKTALCSRKKFGFLDGSIARPAEGSPDLEDWWTIQALLVSWIRMTVEPSLRSNISHCDVAKDLWDHLKKCFSVTNGPRIQQLKVELACCKQRGLAIEAYYGKLNRIWDSMATHRPLRVCQCGKCECDLISLQEIDREEDKVHDFLSGLDDSFNTVRSSLVSRTPIQPMEEVYNIVRQEEDMRTNVTKNEAAPEIFAFAVQQRPRMQSSVRPEQALCKHCNRGGHSSDSCFAVVGYREWWGDRPRRRTMQGKSRGSGLPSSGRGRPMSYANVVHVPPVSSQEHANYVITEKDRDGVSELSDVQWNNLVKLLNGRSHSGAGPSNEKQSSKSSFPSWILDTGASHHLTNNYDILTNVRPMSPVLVVLADGRERVSCQEGTVVLGSNLILKPVFYVAELQYDLISLGQLMDENTCIVQMADQFLVIQDHGSRMMIGAGKRDGGTFRFCRTESVALFTTQEAKAYTLWHQRMGHPSARVVGSLPQVSVSVDSDIYNKACDGPYCTPSSSGARYFLTIVDDYSRSVWIYLQHNKTETAANLKGLIAMATTQFQKQVK
ncbi:PREDICTED: uncharacterized protein LOC104704393 [Camelina sativa]|uniref:Uncharacterized protein LOC104704393 n=1 Tax=Camelina sativa TaxID=90675 RepID=A0ABM0T0B0_CAMSA|nr:PREDICTED: uncharacterized protein LOC104704393 [Camelina sativa]